MRHPSLHEPPAPALPPSSSRRCSPGPLAVLVLLLSLIACPGPSLAADSGYYAVTGPCHLQFPRDNGPHPGYRTEWWYYTGNVQSDDGYRYGFQLTFFRSRISPPGSSRDWPHPHSAWRTQQLYVAHAAVTDISGKHFYHAERMARGALDMAGARQQGAQTTVFVDNWSTRIDPREHLLQAVAADFSFHLKLRPEKPPVLHGDRGYSRKGRSPESSSCYYSFTRLATEGTLTIHGKVLKVHGIAWMDHEFSSAPLEPDLQGWDWFSLQLDNHTEVMIYLLRQTDGSPSPASSGTFVAADGTTRRLTRSMISVKVLDHWRSPHSGIRYPSRWQITIAPEHLKLTVVPNLADQEMRTPETTRVTYWEGSVSISGAAGEAPVQGVGYVELTGYGKPFDAPL